MSATIFSDDFSGFPLGPFPYDPSHSAMGEYHFAPDRGELGLWYDPIVSYRYRGPSWLITAPFLDKRRCMEQMRVEKLEPKKAAPTLRAGDPGWTDYTLSVRLRILVKDGPCGVLFRYQTSLQHYALFMVSGGLEILRINKLERTVLASVDFSWNSDDFYELSVSVEGSAIKTSVNGNQILECEDSLYAAGCIALCAYMPVQYEWVKITAEENAIREMAAVAKEEQTRIAKKTKDYPAPKLWKKFDLKDFGAGRQIRFGHLTGTGELFFVICQHQRRVFKDRYPFISCMTAVSFETGKTLWQKGEPRDDPDVINLTTDLPLQIYDIDNDGIDEVICSWDFKLMILDGRTGQVKKEIPTPENSEKPEALEGIEFMRHAFSRVNVDAIRIVNVSGKARPEDIMIKDRYARLYIYDKDLNFKWKFSHNNTGHFPYAHDFYRDGKDKIFSCYNMIDSDGNLMWKLPINTDHTDEIIFGPIDPDHPEGILAIVSGWEGFMLVDLNGRILFRDINGHGQRISCGNYCPDRKGFEICTTTYWENQGIIYLYDCKGNEIWRWEALCNGNVICPVNWDGTGTDLILLNGNVAYGGLIDGDGDVVVSFPDDGHPDLCAEVLDITGDSRDEIILWDRKQLWVYTQDRPSGSGYKPLKYPMYNASNYRGEYSFPPMVQL
ncbi:MAG: hypothetical protein LBI14_07960 [Treponema sp.]|jgi:hypothetical protein|nr:hypothetical protein [Treponema sp.]